MLATTKLPSDDAKDQQRRFGWEIRSTILVRAIARYLGRQLSLGAGDHGERRQRCGALREIAGDHDMYGASRQALPDESPADYVVAACLSNPLHALDSGNLQIR